MCVFFFFFNDTATTEIYTLSLHDALPIWPTQLKQMPWAPQGTERLAEWKRLIGKRPLVAIGGLTLERALLCLKAGADIAAVVGDIVNHRDPDGQAKAWIAATRRKP